MALFEWSADYELDIPQIDDQHRELVRMINDLYTALKAGDSGSVVDDVLHRLLQYVEIHFETEEASMRESRYPEMEGHIYLHELLRDEVLEMQKSHLQGGHVATFELLNFLADWLKSHIANADMAYGKFLHGLERRASV